MFLLSAAWYRDHDNHYPSLPRDGDPPAAGARRSYYVTTARARAALSESAALRRRLIIESESLTG